MGPLALKLVERITDQNFEIVALKDNSQTRPFNSPEIANFKRLFENQVGLVLTSN